MTHIRIDLSKEFKTMTIKAIASLILFAIVYLIITAVALVITVLCIYGGVMIFISFPRIFTILLGVGLASLGVLLVIFLFKFIFKSHVTDRSHLLEITAKDQPKLFELLQDLVNQVGTSFPKRVYLSADVNASVFYDSSFWSMFFPVRKNLQIGMGLINSVTIEELRAILAHEFGHFSQRTMKVGSYVYNVNQVIYNVLYDNDSYDNLVQKWAEVSGYFAIFVVVAVKIIHLIQWILRKIYEIVNLSYMALSREMEFHADEIAAHISGGDPLKNSLLRMDFADHCYGSVLTFYEQRISDNTKSNNIYPEHEFVMKFLSKESSLEYHHGLPKVSSEDHNKFNKSKLVIKDQWASHPSVEERIERLDSLNIKLSNEDNRPAKEILVSNDQSQIDVTSLLFSNVEYKDETSSISIADFGKQYEKEFEQNSFQKLFNGYYDNKNPLHFDLDSIKDFESKKSISDLFSNEWSDTIYTFIALENDKNTINQIASKELNIKYFDYDGKKYHWKKCNLLIKRIESEIDYLSRQILENDIEIYKYFRKLESSGANGKLESLYVQFFNFDKQFDKNEEIFTNLSNGLHFVNFTTPFDEIRNNFRRIDVHEKDLKKQIQLLLDDPIYGEEITEEIRENLTQYLSQDWRYFEGENYLNDNLDMLFTAMNNFYYLNSRGYFLLKKGLLDYQSSLIKP